MADIRIRCKQVTAMKMTLEAGGDTDCSNATGRDEVVGYLHSL